MPQPAPARPPRDPFLDLLRGFAVIEVVLAHSGLPPLLFQLRNFDVPLLVLLAGWSAGLSMNARPVALLPLLAKRVRQLIVPTWAFLAFYFLLFAVTDRLGWTAKHYDAAIMADSFALGEGIGYVWILRVMLLLTLVAPFIAALSARTESTTRFLLLAAGSIVAGTLAILAFQASRLSGPIASLLNTYLLYLPGFGAVFAIGLRIPRLSERALLAMAAIAGAVFAILALGYGLAAGAFVQTQTVKYPPQAYYLAYALMVDLALVAARAPIMRALSGGPIRDILDFAGRHSLAVYLWHILVLPFAFALAEAGKIPNHYLAIFVVTAAGALVLAALWLRLRAVVIARGWPIPVR